MLVVLPYYSIVHTWLLCCKCHFITGVFIRHSAMLQVPSHCSSVHTWPCNIAGVTSLQCCSYLTLQCCRCCLITVVFIHDPNIAGVTSLQCCSYLALQCCRCHLITVLLILGPAVLYHLITVLFIPDPPMWQVAPRYSVVHTWPCNVAGVMALQHCSYLTLQCCRCHCITALFIPDPAMLQVPPHYSSVHTWLQCYRTNCSHSSALLQVPQPHLPECQLLRAHQWGWHRTAGADPQPRLPWHFWLQLRRPGAVSAGQQHAAAGCVSVWVHEHHRPGSAEVCPAVPWDPAAWPISLHGRWFQAYLTSKCSVCCGISNSDTYWCLWCDLPASCCCLKNQLLFICELWGIVPAFNIKLLHFVFYM